MKKLHYFMLSTLLLSHSAFSSENDMRLLKDLGDSIEFNHRSLFVTNSTPKNPMRGFMVDYTYLYPMGLPTLQIAKLDLNLVIHHEKELHLEGTETAIKNLWAAIQNHPTLTTLHLKGDFTPEQQTDLCKAIESNHVLTSFHAEGQTLSKENREKIATHMMRNPHKRPQQL